MQPPVEEASLAFCRFAAVNFIVPDQFKVSVGMVRSRGWQPGVGGGGEASGVTGDRGWFSNSRLDGRSIMCELKRGRGPVVLVASFVW